MDWQGIRPAEEFMQAIFPAIEGTDTFVFVISPDSVTSEVCGRELAHAVVHNKRMIPVMARDVDAKAVPEALAKLNWVFFCRENDSFEVGTETLISALDTDLGWVRAHTRLLTRVIEWEAKSKSNSFVLRGEDLRAAEQWLAQAGTNKERQPTALQTEYIIASRKAAARRQRITLGAVSFGLVLAVVLAILAWFQRDKALASLSQSDFAEGTRLTNADQPGRALPYFARAVRLTGHPASGTRLASLLTQRAWAVPILSLAQPDAEHARYSRDGRNVISALRDGSIVLRDGATSQPRVVLPRGGKIIEAGISPDGAVLVTLIAAKDGKAIAVQFWNADTGAQVGEGKTVPVDEIGSAFPDYSPAPEQDPGAILFSADGSRVVVYVRWSAAVWDAHAGRKLFDLPERTLGGSFSTDGKRVATSERELGVSVWESATGKLLQRLPVQEGSVPACFALSPDGNRVAIRVLAIGDGGPPGYAQIYDVATGKATTPSMRRETWGRFVEFNADGRWLLMVSEDGAGVWEVATGQPRGINLRNPTSAKIRSASFSPEGGRILLLAEDGTMRVFDAATSQPLIEAFEDSEAASAAWSADGRAIIATSGDGTRQRSWNVLTGAAVPRLLPGRGRGHHDYLQVTAEVPKEEVAAEESADSQSTIPPAPAPVGRTFVWDLQSGEKVIEAAMTLDSRDGNVVFSADGRSVALLGDAAIHIWDLSARRELAPVTLGSGPFLVAVSPDGSRALSVTNQMLLHDLQSGKPPRELKFDPASADIRCACFSPDGKWIAASDASGIVQIWEAASPAARARFQAPLGNVVSLDLQFSPDGRSLFTFGSVAQAWNYRTGETIGPTIGTNPQARSFNVSGSLIAVQTAESLSVLDTGSATPIWPPLPSKFAGGLAFSPDSRRFVTLRGQLWDAKTGRSLLDPIKPPADGSFDTVEFSADSARLIFSGKRALGDKSFALICDAASGIELWRAEREEAFGASLATHLTPDGCLLVIDSDPTEIWDIAPPGKAPAFLADVAEVASGLRLSDAGAIKPLPEAVTERARLRKQVSGVSADNRWARIVRWFLAEPPERASSPYARVESARTNAAQLPDGTFESLRWTIRARPDDALAQAALGLASLTRPARSRSESEDCEPCRIEANYATSLATLLAPKHPEVWRARAEVLTALGRSAEASAASEKAAALTMPRQ